MTPITEVSGRRLTLSNLEKVLYPATGTTKGELLHYYTQVADAFLAHAAGRPMSFLRYPDGGAGPVFFTKSPPNNTPSWVRVAGVPRSSDERGEQVVIDDLPALVWAANLVVEFHTPQWCAATPARADRIVFDLDPGEPATVVECCEVALWLRERLRADGFEAYAKTSGSKGLHLLVAVERAPSDRVSAYARRLAREAEAAMPERVVHRMKRSLRPGKVFVDHSQNAAAKTTAAPYTARARPEPTVSAPVTWEEVARCRRPSDLVLLIGDVADRLRAHGDLMRPLLQGGPSLPG